MLGWRSAGLLATPISNLRANPMNTGALKLNASFIVKGGDNSIGSSTTPVGSVKFHSVQFGQVQGIKQGRAGSDHGVRQGLLTQVPSIDLLRPVCSNHLFQLVDSSVV